MASNINALVQLAEKQYKKSHGRDADAGIKILSDILPPTGIIVDNPLLEFMLGRRFLAYGRCYLSYAKKGAGKSSCLYEMMKIFQNAGGEVFYIETEKAYDKDYMKMMGVDIDRVAFCDPDNIETALEICLSIAKALPDFAEENPDTPVMIALDSIAGIGAAKEFETSLTTTGQVGYHAKLLSAFYRRICKYINGEKAVFWATNQLKDVIGGMTFGQEKGEAMLGGEAQRFHSTYQLKFSKVKDLIVKSPEGIETKIGSKHFIMPKRNKLGIEGKTRQIEVDFYMNGGADWYSPLARYVGDLKNDLFKKNGGWYLTSKDLPYIDSDGKAQVCKEGSKLREDAIAQIIANSSEVKESIRTALGIPALPTAEEETKIEEEAKKIRKKKKVEIAKDTDRLVPDTIDEEAESSAIIKDSDDD